MRHIPPEEHKKNPVPAHIQKHLHQNKQLPFSSAANFQLKTSPQAIKMIYRLIKFSFSTRFYRTTKAFPHYSRHKWNRCLIQCGFGFISLSATFPPVLLKHIWILAALVIREMKTFLCLTSSATFVLHWDWIFRTVQFPPEIRVKMFSQRNLIFPNYKTPCASICKT